MMARFSNGAEGLYYQEEYCMGCINFKDRDDDMGVGCPVWDLHLFWVGKPEDEEKEILDYLIPSHDTKKGVRNDKCIWHNKDLGINTMSAINLTLEQWQELMDDCEIEVVSLPLTPEPQACEGR